MRIKFCLACARGCEGLHHDGQLRRLPGVPHLHAPPNQAPGTAGGQMLSPPLSRRVCSAQSQGITADLDRPTGQAARMLTSETCAEEPDRRLQPVKLVLSGLAAAVLLQGTYTPSAEAGVVIEKSGGKKVPALCCAALARCAACQGHLCLCLRAHRQPRA